jgi:hypothetical protein
MLFMQGREIFQQRSDKRFIKRIQRCRAVQGNDLDRTLSFHLQADLISHGFLLFVSNGFQGGGMRRSRRPNESLAIEMNCARVTRIRPCRTSIC